MLNSGYSLKGNKYSMMADMEVVQRREEFPDRQLDTCSFFSMYFPSAQNQFQM